MGICFAPEIVVALSVGNSFSSVPLNFDLFKITFLLPGTTNALGSFCISPVPDIEFLLLEPGSFYRTMVFRNQDLGMKYAYYC